MDSKKKKKLYEDFHEGVQIAQIPKDTDFTYGIILPKIKPYLKKDVHVLDIGCGNGVLSFYAAQQGAQVMGLEISEKAVDSCELSAQKLNMSDKVKFMVGDFAEVEFKKKFDVIFLLEVIEHLEKDEEALERMADLLNPGGVLILSTPSKNAPVHRLKKLFFGKDQFDISVGHLRRYTVSDLKRLLEKQGFEILKIHKNEGFLRNFLFVTKVGNLFLRFVRWHVKKVVTFIDNIMVPVFGESDIIVIAKKR